MSAEGQGSTDGQNLKNDLIAAIPSLRAFAISISGSSDRADDLVQETLVKAWGSLDSFAEGTNLTAWLFTILRNIYYSEHRRRRREAPDPDGEMAARLVSPESQNAHMDFLDFREALQKLPLDQREALILVAAQGMSYEEAAEICGCAPGTMKSRVNRARNRLADLMSLPNSGREVAQPRAAALTPAGRD
ncbi:sigma-70 family RNA polymerase sigma factor [Methylocystis sp. MJC1]|uniref:sigma-70 family RNA polymerase sigma factor n=1 Tax=Methylocystis sp. MJC1 TaxID=2654282 RepID=UPI0013EE2C8A|nr:sigma-70 family RNA polymerase sigma factor [Methylocystis sp. MJC1]KAF2991919.1 ECF RNA polymerase sigma factor EcfG [Methylocystis sp. MJC1]MBU6525408.1 sigma-70 family RNA polymerase sigma factor [Methylocystis sp. MJC1]UZX11900.1 sigma-70 family RNA polymerase sigma factor [Methylocystis sp. MJC1]